MLRVPRQQFLYSVVYGLDADDADADKDPDFNVYEPLSEQFIRDEILEEFRNDRSTKVCAWDVSFYLFIYIVILQ